MQVYAGRVLGPFLDNLMLRLIALRSTVIVIA
jgi:hypothetical protein